MAALELYATGRLPKRKRQIDAYNVFSKPGWTKAGPNRCCDEIELIGENAKNNLRLLLDRNWDDWRTILKDLETGGYTVTPKGYEDWRDMRRMREIAPERLPKRLNRKSANALLKSHSKSGSSMDAVAEAFPGTEITHDNLVRLKPGGHPDSPASFGVWARAFGRVMALDDIAAFTGGEVAIPQRAFLDGFIIEGHLKALLLVENIGPWRDIHAPEGWLVAHVPGRDTSAALCLLDGLTDVPVVHFGDLDSAGVEIMLGLRKKVPDLRWFVPGFWFEKKDAHGQKSKDWADDMNLDAPEILSSLSDIHVLESIKELVREDSASGQLVRGVGRVIPLARIYRMHTSLPGSDRDYSRTHFARDLYLLDASGITATRSGATVAFPASTGARSPRAQDVFTFVDREGREPQYYGIRFTESG